MPVKQGSGISGRVVGQGQKTAKTIRAGLAHARQNGQKLGGPTTAALHAEIRKLHRTGVSKSEIARRLNIERTSVRRMLAKGKM